MFLEFGGRGWRLKLAFCWEKLKGSQQAGTICKVSEENEDSPCVYMHLY